MRDVGAGNTVQDNERWQRGEVVRECRMDGRVDGCEEGCEEGCGE